MSWMAFMVFIGGGFPAVAWCMESYKETVTTPLSYLIPEFACISYSLQCVVLKWTDLKMISDYGVSEMSTLLWWWHFAVEKDWFYSHSYLSVTSYCLCAFDFHFFLEMLLSWSSWQKSYFPLAIHRRPGVSWMEAFGSIHHHCPFCTLY